MMYALSHAMLVVTVTIASGSIIVAGVLLGVEMAKVFVVKEHCKVTHTSFSFVNSNFKQCLSKVNVTLRSSFLMFTFSNYSMRCLDLNKL